MSEEAPVYIPCGSGNNAFAELLVRCRGDLITLWGHAQMDLTPADAAKLGKVLMTLARAKGYRDLEDAL